MKEYTGWLLDLYPNPTHGHLTLWLLCENGKRYPLHHRFPVVFYAGGSHHRLHDLGIFLKKRYAGHVTLGRVQRRVLLEKEPLTVMEIRVERAAWFPRLMRTIEKPFVDLDFYDNDIRLPTRYAAAYDVFPMLRCRVVARPQAAQNRQELDPGGDWIQSIEPLESRWDPDPLPPPLRVLGITPNCDPFHAHPKCLKIAWDDRCFQLQLARESLLLQLITELLNDLDPDIIVSRFGDDWILPYLSNLARRRRVHLPLSRDPKLQVTRHSGGVHFTYGQVVRRGPQSLLHGRLHIDARNTLSIGDVALEGVIETARVGGLPVQTAARTSPGATLTSMKMITYLRRGIMVPNFKQQTEDEKDILTLTHSDKGGLIFTPIAGLHSNVVEVDFTSMFPWIARRYNISPETIHHAHLQDRDPRRYAPASAKRSLTEQFQPWGPVGQAEQERSFIVVEAGMLANGSDADQPGLDLESLQGSRFAQNPPGMLAETLTPLLEKRMHYKRAVAEMDADDPRYGLFKNRLGAHKDIGVVAYGRTKFRKETDGKVEVHESITDFARKSMVLAKMTAESLGYRFLHGYVDALYLQKPDAASDAEVQELLDAIIRVTGLPIVLEGRYKWMAFMPSKRKPRLPVANRFFGIDESGDFKIRGLASRRKDTPAWIAQCESQILQVLRQAPGVEDLQNCIPRAVSLLRKQIEALRAGRIPVPDLVLTKKLTKAPEEYRTRTDSVRAARQLIEAGKQARIADHVRFVYVRGAERVYAWDLPEPLDPRRIDSARYQELAIRSAHMILQMLAVTEDDLKRWLGAKNGLPQQKSLFPRPQGF